ncbi:MAG: c-type cytochrome biogenesis protein CcmI [Proteobacteria bacterium]|nr:c-type cytochrome biogenesis protein CcmI [Pseudomonadota bacterium]
MVWVISALITLAVVFVILRAFFIAPSGAKTSELDVQVYKDQLQSLDDDLERGVVTSGEADAARLEISRRLLAADKRAQSETAAAGAAVSKPALAVMAVFLIGGTFGLYAFMGSPQLPDQPLAGRHEAARIARLNRPNQVEAEAEIGSPGISGDVPADYLELIEKLRETMALHTDDAAGWKLLALHEARIGNLTAAWQAKEKVIALLGDATEAEDYADLAEFMIISTNGYVSIEAEEALANALRLNAKSPRARYFSGLALAQNGRPDVAYRMWIGLLEEGPEDAPWNKLIRGQISTVARAAGIDMVDQNAPGPSAEQVEAAGDMTAEERQKMIGGMVAGLAERLAEKGGTPAEWARLIRAYGSLGETGKASKIWAQARDIFAENPDATAVLLEAARAAEVAN